jgi:hydroxypyruvate reductase
MTLPDPHTAPRQFLQALYRTAVDQALPAHRLADFLPAPPQPPGARTLVVGAGKAGAAMAHALEAAWPAYAPLQGLVVTRYGHVPPRAANAPGARIEVVEAAHPVPDAAGLEAAQRMLALVQGLSEHDLVICLISGGGSSLLTLPAQWPGGGLGLEDKQRINRALLASGASISEMNCVRKHLSAIKGGRLAAACAPARVVTLLISDVPGDDASVIASGPTVPDPTTCAQALQVLQRYAIDIPDALRQQLETGALETPKPDASVFAGNAVHLMATPQQSLDAAARAARAAGVEAHILSDEMEGESREVGRVHAALARAVAQRGQPFARPCVILSGGETTVTLRPQKPCTPKGRGGRAGEFCLGLAQALQAQPGVYALAADTDGIDGVEDNAGAWVTPDTLERARAQGLRVEDHLDRNDAYGYFSLLGDLLITGPSYTNVNDFRAILVL